MPDESAMLYSKKLVDFQAESVNSVLMTVEQFREQYEDGDLLSYYDGVAYPVKDDLLAPVVLEQPDMLPHDATHVLWIPN